MKLKSRVWMESEDKAGLAEKRCAEVAELARRYLNQPGFGGLEEIEMRISEAQDDSRWDDMSKWHRVKLRLIRMKQQRQMADAMRSGFALAAGK